MDEFEPVPAEAVRQPEGKSSEGASSFIIALRKKDEKEAEIETGGYGCDCTGGNHREPKTSRGGIGWSNIRFSRTAPVTPIKMRETFSALRVSTAHANVSKVLPEVSIL